MGNLLNRLKRCRRGATAIEYGFIVALICIAIVGLLGTVGGKVFSIWGNSNSKFPTVQG